MVTEREFGTGKIEISDQKPAISKLPESLRDEFKTKMGELLDLTEDQKKRLKRGLKENIQNWITDTSTLHQNLIEDNDLVEGVIPETDFPYVGSSNIHVGTPGIYMDIYRSTERRSILGADKIWYGEPDIRFDEIQTEQMADIEAMLNFKARNEWNIEHALENVFWTTNRDGLGILQITWDERFRKSRDIVLITNEEEFIAEFVSPEESGISPEKFEELLKMAQTEATEDTPIEIPVTFEKVIYRGNRGDVIDLVNFVTFPATCRDIDDEECVGYGKRFKLRKETIRKKAKDGIYYENEVRKLLKNSGSTKITEFETTRDEIEGLSRSSKNNFELFEMAIIGKIDGEKGEEEQFLVTYSFEHDELVGAINYPYRLPFYALFKIDERPNRMIGRSIPGKIREISNEIDNQHNQRINTREITTIPSFKGRKSAKKGFDPNAEEHRWGIGKIFWLENPEDFQQFKVQPTDLGESLNEENNDFRIIDLILGSASSLLSGGPSPTDPNAPGNKTVTLIQQSNLRMDEPLNQLRRGVEKTGEICLSHQFQFDKPVIRFRVDETAEDKSVQRVTKTLHKKLLRRGFIPKMSGITVTSNPDFEQQRLFGLYATLMQEEMFAKRPQSRIAVLQDALKAGREPGRKRYLPSAEEIQAEAVEIQRQIIEAERLQQQQAEEEALKGRIDEATQTLKIQNTGEKLAESNLEAPVEAQ